MAYPTYSAELTLIGTSSITVASAVVDTPATVNATDNQLMFVHITTKGTTIAASGGWTSLGSQSSTGGTAKVEVFKRTGAYAAGTITLTFTGGNTAGKAVVLGLVGVVGVATFGEANSFLSTHTGVNGTSTADETLAVHFVGTGQYPRRIDIPGSGYTAVTGVDNNLNDYVLGSGFATTQIATSGGTSGGTGAWTFRDPDPAYAPNTERSIKATVVVTPPIGGGGPSTTITGNAEIPRVLTTTVSPIASVAVGSTGTATLTVVDQNGDPIPNAAVTITSGTPSVATASVPAVTNSLGQTTTTLTTLTAGTTNITATCAGVASSAQAFVVTALAPTYGNSLLVLFRSFFMQIQRSTTNAAQRKIPFFAIDDDGADSFAPKTGLTFSPTEVKLSKNGAAEVDGTGTITEIGGGAYCYNATQAEVDTLGFLTIRPVKTDVYSMTSIIQIVGFDPYDGEDLGLSNLTETDATNNSVGFSR
jgi:hypothetical protein